MVFLTTLLLNAQTQKNLDQARIALDQGNYKQSMALIEPLIEGLKLNTLEHILAAYTILGIAYCQDQQDKKAEQAFAYLLSYSPEEKITFAMSKRCWRMFHDLKYPHREKNFSLNRAQIIHKPQPWKNYMPFGVAQYYQKRSKTASWLLTLESLSTVSLSTSLVLFKQAQNDDGSFTDTQKASLYRSINWGSLAVLSSSIIYGLFDGIKHKKTKSSASAQ